MAWDVEPVREAVRRLPAPALRSLVAWYAGYRQLRVPPATHRGLPGPYLTMILTLEHPLTIAEHPDRRIAPASYTTLVGGLHTAPALISHTGQQGGIQLGLTPLGARALLGLPAGELANQDLDGAAVAGVWVTDLHERIQAAASWEQRFSALDTVLLRRAGRGRSMASEVAATWQRLLCSGGQVAVSRLADEVGWSTRHLSQRFRCEIGLSPKAAARVVRFDRARRILQDSAQGPAFTLARLAADTGYYDQAHLDRDFHSFAGCAPSLWLAEEFRNVQGAPALVGADSDLFAPRARSATGAERRQP
ncbi:MAG: AraC family transcriptional regulator [Actinomycetota bacterium]